MTWMDCGTGIIVWDIGAGRLQRVAGQAYSIVPLTTPRQHPLPEILPMIDGSVNIARLPGLNWNQTSSINAYKRGILTLEALPASERNRMLSRYARKKVMTHESIARTKEKARIEIIQENGKSRGLNKSERTAMIKRLDNTELIGARVRTFFPGHGWFRGAVDQVKKSMNEKDPVLYHIVYEDGDEQDATLTELINKHNLELPHATSNAVFQIIDLDDNLHGKQPTTLDELRSALVVRSRPAYSKPKSTRKSHRSSDQAKHHEAASDKTDESTLVCMICFHENTCKTDMLAHIGSHNVTPNESMIGERRSQKRFRCQGGEHLRLSKTP